MANDLYFSDLVGRRARVVKCSNANSTGIEGTICDETMKTVHIMSEGKEKVVPKAGTVFSVEYGDGEVEVDGDAIIFRPEDRIKQHSRIEKNLKRRK